MSDKKYYSVQVHVCVELCVQASDENEAERMAEEADVDFTMCSINVDEVEEMYNDPEEADCLKEFEEEGRLIK